MSPEHLETSLKIILRKTFVVRVFTVIEVFTCAIRPCVFVQVNACAHASGWNSPSFTCHGGIPFDPLCGFPRWDQGCCCDSGVGWEGLPVLPFYCPVALFFIGRQPRGNAPTRYPRWGTLTGDKGGETHGYVRRLPQTNRNAPSRPTTAVVGRDAAWPNMTSSFMGRLFEWRCYAQWPNLQWLGNEN